MKKILFIIILVIIYNTIINAIDQDFQEGINLYNEKKFQEALNKFTQLEKVYNLNKKDNQSNIANCYIWIGACYYNLSDFQKALDYYKKSLSINKILNDQESIIKIYNSMSQIYEQLNDYENLIKCYESASNIYFKLNVIL